ncbi:MAG: NAD(P)H-dependent oxidoreductase [Methanothrix sp.]
MRVLTILAHPHPGSFNHAIAEAAVAALEASGHEIVFHDLYAEGFDPLLSSEEIPKGAQINEALARHCRDLSEAEGIIVVHPNWWGMPPAILKGWVDRVVRPGVAYEFLEGDSGEGVPRGLLRARKALVFNTTNTGAKREQEAFGDPLQTLWKNCIFGLCGVEDFRRKSYGVVVTSTEAERRAWLDDVRRRVRECFP